jgi:cysteine desulfurase
VSPNLRGERLSDQAVRHACGGLTQSGNCRTIVGMIYLDHNATTPILPEVLEAMMPYLTTEWGNPSSSYRFGSKLKGKIEEAREQVAELLGARASEIIFTSCGTESNNTAIHAAIRANPGKRHIITSAVEHSSVLNHCKALEQEGYRVTYLPVDREGLLNLADLQNAIDDDTAVVSLMWANNETGVLFPVEAIAEICQASGVLYHCDAVQAAGKLEINLRKVPIHYLSITGHKIGAPKGSGALYVRRKSSFSPFLHGGHQERNRRGGTENLAFIIGLGIATEYAKNKVIEYDHIVRPMRDEFEDAILRMIPGSELNGHKFLRLPNTSNIALPGIASEALLILLDREGICASSGSACLAESENPSHVIEAMKAGHNLSKSSVRFSLSMHDAEHLAYAPNVIVKAYFRISGISTCHTI